MKLIKELCKVGANGEEAICAIAPDIGFNKTYEGFLDEWKIMEDIDYIVGTGYGRIAFVYRRAGRRRVCRSGKEYPFKIPRVFQSARSRRKKI